MPPARKEGMDLVNGTERTHPAVVEAGVLNGGEQGWAGEPDSTS